MKNHILKAFITSFCVSMFVIFIASNVFVSQEKEKEIKIVPSKNIALFFNSNHNVAANPISNVKKIALTIEPLIIKAPIQEAQEIASVNVPVLKEDVNIPLVYATPTIPKEKIIENYQDFVKKPINIKITKPELVAENILYAPQESKIKIAKAEDNAAIPITKNNEVVFNGKAKVEESSNLTTKVAQSSTIMFNQTTSNLKEAITSNNTESKEDNNSPWIKMEDTPPQNEAWSVTKGVTHPKNKLMATKNQETPPAPPAEKEEKKPLQNILIPLPDDFEQTANKTPQIISSKTQEAIIEEEKPKKNILKNITSLFSKTSEKVEKETKEIISGIAQTTSSISQKAERNIKKIGTKKGVLPAEIRLVFAPNRVEISGQTLSWLNAFAQKSKEENVGLEIRIDGTHSPTLQQKRLNLVYNILAAKKVEPHRVMTTFTNRDPNSFVIRVIKLNKQKEVVDYKKYYQQQ